MTKFIGFGTELTMNATAVGQIFDISGPNVSSDDIDVSSMDQSDNYKTFLRGMADGGEVTFSLFADPADAQQVSLAAALDSGTTQAFALNFPTTTINIGFSAYVNGMSSSYPIDGAIARDVALKVSGDPGYTS